MPFLHANDADSPPGRSFTNALLAAYIPGLQRETSHRNVSTFAPTVGNALYDGMKNESPNQLSTQNSKLLTSNTKPRSVALKERLIGSKINETKGSAQSATVVSYFKGSDPSKWRSNIATYEMVDMGEVYDGVCLRLKAYGDNVEKLFTVKPGADAGQIRIRLDGIKSSPVSVEAYGKASLCGQQALFEGEKQPPESPFIKGNLTESPLEKDAMGLSVKERGELVAETKLGPVKFTKPVAYQEIGGKRVEVAVEYRIQEPEIGGEERLGAGKHGGSGEPETPNSQLETRNSKPTYGFTVASYDKTKDLIIDPLLASTYLGGRYVDSGESITIDPSGNVYVTGYAYVLEFLTTCGAYNTSYNGGYDVIVSKFDRELKHLLANTLLGGGSYERGIDIILDASGNVYVTGFTSSSNFPTTRGAYDTSYNSDYDVFITKLNGGLTRLLASTFLGSVYNEIGVSLFLDTSMNVYVTGWTNSSAFPTTRGAYDTSFNGEGDVFVSKLDSGLKRLQASTFLGGNDVDSGNSLTLDASGNAYVTGYTDSKNFPTTSGVYDTSFNGDSDVFVSKLDSGLTSLLASTFLGGSRYDIGLSLTLDNNENVYAMGSTKSFNFPMTSGAYDTTFNGYYDVFISKLDSGLTGLQASTLLGGNDEDGGNSLTLDTSGNIFVTGYTRSKKFPMTSGAYDTSYNRNCDVFVSKLDSNLSANQYVAESICEAESITASHNSLTPKKGEDGDVIITVVGADNCPVEGVAVTATIYGKGKRLIDVSPGSQETDSNGHAVFSIGAKNKKGTAVIKFKASGLDEVATVRVKVR